MKGFLLQVVLSGLAWSAACVTAGEVVVQVDGKELRLPYTVVNREVVEADRQKGDQDSAVGCALLVNSYLGKGDLKAAAAATADPAKAMAKWTKYQAALGADEFKKEMNAFFTSKIVIAAQLSQDTDTLLVLKTPDGILGQFYRQRQGKFVLLPTPPRGGALVKALEMFQDEKIKL